MDSPSRLSDPIVATDSVVTSERTSLLISKVTSMLVPGEFDALHLADFLAAQRTTAPVLSPPASANRVLSG